jgi:hypothetical protein
LVDNLYYFNQFDRKLATDMEVLACWTANGFSFQGRAVITRLKRDRAIVRLRQTVGPTGDFPSGKKIEIPRFTDQTQWSTRNCVLPCWINNTDEI